MAIYSFNGVPVHLHMHGPAHGPLAVLIHGWASSSYTWKPVLPMLSRRYRCISVDLPGFGDSPRPGRPPTIGRYAELIAQLIEQFSDRDALVFGHSMGGQIAATLALRHPPLVQRLVLLNPAISGRLSTRVNLTLAPYALAEFSPVVEWLLYLAAKTPLDYTDWLLKPSNFAARAQISEEDYCQIRADARRRGQGRVRAACFLAMRRGDLRQMLGKIETPALVVWGAEDNVVPLRDAGSVSIDWPAADLRIIPNAGHWPQFEQPDITLRHITHFLGLPPEVDEAHRDPDESLEQIEETARFLSSTEIGGSLNAAQRLRLASLLHTHRFGPGQQIAMADSSGDELYLVRAGTLEVWLRSIGPDEQLPSPVRLARLQIGQVAGELALLDGASRSAEMRAGPEGLTVLTLSRAAFDALTEDDPATGMRLMQNLAISLGRRLRLQNWQSARK